jgi:hypothetical protein
MSDKRHLSLFINSSKEGMCAMLTHHIRPITGAADTLPHRSFSVAPGKEAGSRTEFSSSSYKDAADIHVHAYASGRTVVQRAAKRPATVHGN